ncbi:cell wall anchor protein, partial [Microbacterium maritypicum]
MTRHTSRQRARRFGAALVVSSLALFGLSAALVPSAANAAGGTLLLNETFTGADVPDSRAIGLNDACLTGAALGSTPPAGASNLSDCEGHTDGGPPPGVVPGWLQLTDSAFNRTGGMVFNRALPSSAGLQVEFDQAQYGGSSADGIGFFLTDGSRELTQTGAIGGSLGYGQGENGTIPGVSGGYIGVGLDSFGNFIGDFGGLGNGCAVPSPFTTRVPNTVTLRGPGDGAEGYCFLTTTATAPTGPSTLPGSLRVGSPVNADAAVRNVRVTVSPGDFPLVTVEIDFTGTKANYQTVLSYVMTDQAPATYKFGFSGSTGQLRDVHVVRNVVVYSVDSLGEISLIKQVDNTTPQPEAYGVGDTVPYQFVVTNTGDEAITDVEVTDPLISDIICPETTLGAAGGPDASMVCSGSLVVTGLQAQNDTLLNTATVTALDSTGSALTDSSEVTVPLVAPAPGLSIDKVASLNDTNSNGLADAGETIDYSFVVLNTGNVTLTGVSVDDPKAG